MIELIPSALRIWKVELSGGGWGPFMKPFRISGTIWTKSVLFVLVEIIECAHFCYEDDWLDEAPQDKYMETGVTSGKRVTEASVHPQSIFEVSVWVKKLTFQDHHLNVQL